MVNMMMTGVTRSGDGANFERRHSHNFRVRPGLAESSSHVIEGRFRAGVEQCDTVVRLERGRGHNPGTSKLSRIKNGDQGRIKKYELRNRRRVFRAFQNCDNDSDQFVALSTENI